MGWILKVCLQLKLDLLLPVDDRGYGSWRLTTEVVELLEAVKASLKAKVAALSDDNWMFEREEVLHLH